jgi:hypothetical protein
MYYDYHDCSLYKENIILLIYKAQKNVQDSGSALTRAFVQAANLPLLEDDSGVLYSGMPTGLVKKPEID